MSLHSFAAPQVSGAPLAADTPVIYSDTQLAGLDLLAPLEPCDALRGLALREVGEPAVFRHFFAEHLFGRPIAAALAARAASRR